jgi:hypothetical protein
MRWICHVRILAHVLTAKATPTAVLISAEGEEAVYKLPPRVGGCC